MIREVVWDRYSKLITGEFESDHLKVFVKPEPHKVKKLEEGRLRLIMSVSLVDSLVDRILFIRLAYRVIANYSKTGMMIGWSPLHGGYRQLNAIFGELDTISIDKKAWDWSVPHWLLMLVKRLIINLSPGAPEWWKKAVHARFHCLFSEPTFVFSDGTVGKQEKPGVMKSGCYLTLIINSMAQLLLHHIVVAQMNMLPKDFEPIIVIGDDSLQKKNEHSEKYVETLLALGFRVETEEHSSVREFAGFLYERNKFVPSYKNKHRFLLERLPMDDKQLVKETLASYQIIYYFDDEMLSVIQSIALALNIPEAITSKDALRSIVVDAN
nr:RNA-dependent RNA polymerase [Solemoviridae sp.]